MTGDIEIEPLFETVSFFFFLLLLLRFLRFLRARRARLALELLSIRIAAKIKIVEPITAGNKKMPISLFYASLHCHYHQVNEHKNKGSTT